MFKKNHYIFYCYSFNILKYIFNTKLVLVFIVLLFLGLKSTIAFSNKSYDLRTFNVTEEVIEHLINDFLDPSRLEPDNMFIEGIKRLQRNFADFRIIEENNSVYTIHVGNESLSINTEQLITMEDLITVSNELMFLIQYNHRIPVEPDDVQYHWINGVLDYIDPHSYYYTIKDYKRFKTRTGGSFSGVGMRIGLRDGKLTVISPIIGTPAYNAGINTGDKVLKIDNVSTINMSLEEAVNRIRGIKGTIVELFIVRNGTGEERLFKIKRDVVKLESINSEPLDSGIGYVSINDFQANTVNQLEQHIDWLKQDLGEIKGLIVDLRGNSGGLKRQSIKVSDLFIEKGTLLSTVKKKRDGLGWEITGISKANKKRSQTSYPLVVLCNAGSASASEIVIGALKLNDRAIVVGDITFGKGSVQKVKSLSNGSAIKFTINQYLPAGELSVQNVGITPDIQLTPYSLSDNNIQLRGKEKVRKEKGLDRTFDNWANISTSSMYKLNYLQNTIDRNDRSLDLWERDDVVRIAMQLILYSGNTSRIQWLNDAEKIIGLMKEQEIDKLEMVMEKRGIDWSLDNPNRAKINQYSINIKNHEFNVTKKPIIVKAGEEFKWIVKLKNLGLKAASRISLLTESENQIFDTKEAIVGLIKPNQEKSAKIIFSLPDSIKKTIDEVTLNVLSENNELVNSNRFIFKIVENQKPEFSYSYSLIDDDRFGSKGNNNNIAELGEVVAIKVNLKHIDGCELSENASLKIYTENEQLELLKGSVSLPKMKKGEKFEAVFLINVLRKSLKGNFGFIELRLWDKKLKSGFVQNINIFKGNELYKTTEMINVNKIKLINPNFSITELKEISIEFKITGSHDILGLYISADENKLGFYEKNQLKKDINKQYYFEQKVDLKLGLNNINIIAYDEFEYGFGLNIPVFRLLKH